MHTIDITGYKTVQYASCIEELSHDEFIYMMKLLLMQQKGEITIEHFRFMLTLKLLNIRKTVTYYMMPAAERELVHDNMNRLVETIDSFYEHTEEDGKLVKKLSLNWIKQMMPTIGNLVGPADALTNCTIYEYKEAFTRYTDYLKNKDTETLVTLIAILYRPRKFCYGIRKLLSWNSMEERQSFTEKTGPERLARRAGRVNHLPEHIKTAVLLWFGNCIEYIVSGKPTIDGIEIDFSLLFSKNKDDSGPSGIGLTGIIYSLAESSVFGNAEKTSNTNLYDILVRLYQLKTDYDAMVAKSKKNDKD